MNFTGHLKTITRHRMLVMKYCVLCGIPFRGLVHDLSKYSPTEFLAGAKYYEQGGRSPNAHEREVRGYSTAWLHHKGRNPHHFEYWYDVSPVTKVYEPIPMPLSYLKESFCDRVAATHIYNGDNYRDSDALDYFLLHSSERGMHPCTACILESWLRMLAEEGEAKTFAYIRRIGEIQYCDNCKKMHRR